MTVIYEFQPCPRCGGIEYGQIDCGPDGYEDDITYTSDRCTNCNLWYDGWLDKWFDNIECWQDTNGAEEYKSANPQH